MLLNIFLLSVLISAGSACHYPNNTDTKLHWFQTCTDRVVIHDVTPTDASGNLQYPIYLDKPLYLRVNLTNNGPVYSRMTLNSNIEERGGWTCVWEAVPTMGLLRNQDACSSGYQCPIPQGSQVLTISIDFSKYAAIIALIGDENAYQIEQTITDYATGQTTCVTVQVKASKKSPNLAAV